jgi:hypothetical protein
MKTLLAFLLAALAAAPAALADGPPQYAALGGPGVASPKPGGPHYVAVPAGSNRTILEVIARDGTVESWPTFAGNWGIPTVDYSQYGGLSRDGRTLFLQSTGYGAPTRFLVVDTRTLTVRDWMTLRGNFSFDALSPDAKRLYLIQRVDANDASRYVVRAYDLQAHRLLPGRIADRTQKSWVMQGLPVTRAVSPDGRWAYTLYMNPGGYPFVHALDTVRGVAHCIGIPWAAPNQDALWQVALRVDGGKLLLDRLHGRRWLAVDRTTWRVAAVRAGGFPWRWAALGGGAALAAALLLLALRRRRPRNEGTLLAPAA